MKKLLLAAALAFAPAMASAGGMAYTTGDLHLRGAPGMSGHVMTIMPKGSSVHVHGCNAHAWCQVSFGNHKGYASGHWMAWQPGHSPRARAQQNGQRSHSSGINEGAVAGFLLGSAAVVVAGPAGGLLLPALTGGVAGGIVGQAAHEQHTRGKCRYTSPHTGRSWYGTCTR